MLNECLMGESREKAGKEQGKPGTELGEMTNMRMTNMGIIGLSDF
jgi:hypothetical protein